MAICKERLANLLAIGFSPASPSDVRNGLPFRQSPPLCPEAGPPFFAGLIRIKDSMVDLRPSLRIFIGGSRKGKPFRTSEGIAPKERYTELSVIERQPDHSD